MQVHARISQEWRRRMTIMALMINSIGLWFLYDGYIAWPAEAKRYEQLLVITKDLVPADGKLDREDPAIIRAWMEYSAQNKLSAKLPKERTPPQMNGQRVIGTIIFGGGMLFVAWIFLQHRKSVRADGDLITGANGEQVNLDQIIAVDRKKWASKGIAYAIYEQNGKNRRLCLDDHKFIGCEAIILEAERRIAARSEATTPPPAV